MQNSVMLRIVCGVQSCRQPDTYSVAEYFIRNSQKLRVQGLGPRFFQGLRFKPVDSFDDLCS